MRIIRKLTPLLAVLLLVQTISFFYLPPGRPLIATRSFIDDLSMKQDTSTNGLMLFTTYDKAVAEVVNEIKSTDLAIHWSHSFLYSLDSLEEEIENFKGEIILLIGHGIKEGLQVGYEIWPWENIGTIYNIADIPLFYLC